jgi:CHAD domain-containing protein
MTEREIKLALPGRFVIPPLSHGDAQLEVETLPELTLRATYFDTLDLRLARHGVTLRYRTGEPTGPIWTVKLPVATDGAELVRDEVHLEGGRQEPPPAARSLVTAFARRLPLVAVATLRTRRRPVRLVADGQPIAELADDEVSVVEGRRVVSRFRELELEALADEADLAPIADRLREAGAADAEPIPKVVRALGSRATAPSDIAGTRTGPNPTMADALSASLADNVGRLIHHDPLARLGRPEGVHQVRVALRRLRSDLRTLQAAVDPAWRAQIEPQLRAIADELSQARDTDVLIGHLRADLGNADGRLRPLRDRLEQRRSDARDRLRACLDGEAYLTLLDALVEAVASPPAGPTARQDADDALPTLVASAWRRLKRRGDAVDEGSSDEHLHRVRIAAKRARYAAELASRVLQDRRADAAATAAKKVVAVQDKLGALQDSVVAESVIRETLAGPRITPRYAFEAGRLVERQRARGAAARAEFADVWADLRRKRWWKWTE